MKRAQAIKSGFVILAALAFFGCSKGSDNVPVRGSARSSGITTASAAGVSLVGIVEADDSQQDTFNQMVRDMMLPMIEEDAVGYVSDQLLNNTGVYFGGNVKFATNSGSSYGVDPTSTITVQVFDQFTGQQGVPELRAFQLSQAQGTVSGGQANLQFQDAYGTIGMSGTYDQNWYTGTFTFVTTKAWNGAAGPGTTETLGTFKVPTCQFFQCN